MRGRKKIQEIPQRLQGSRDGRDRGLHKGVQTPPGSGQRPSLQGLTGPAASLAVKDLRKAGRSKPRGGGGRG